MRVVEVWTELDAKLEVEEHKFIIFDKYDPHRIERTVYWMRKHLGEYDPDEPAIIPHLGKAYVVDSIDGDTVNVFRYQG